MLQSLWFVLLASVLLPPAGLVLLWLRSGIRIKDKVFGSTVIAVWSVAYLMFFFGLRFPLDGSGMRPIPTFGTRESHYSQLERSRKQPPDVVEAAATPAAVTPGSAYWTDFRGPKRDGRYDQAPIRADWPAKGLPLVWRQPIGGGYASFVIAGGRAFTIQRRPPHEAATRPRCWLRSPESARSWSSARNVSWD